MFCSLDLNIYFNQFVLRPMSPVQRALEVFHMDFEFGDEPSDTSLIANYEIFNISKKRPDMFITDQRGYEQVQAKSGVQI